MMYDGCRDTPRDPRKESFPPIVWDSSSVIISQNTGYISIVQQYERQYTLKGQCKEIFDFSFLHGSAVSSKPLIIPLGPFQIFSKIHRDIRSSRCTTIVIDTGGKWEKSSNRKMFIISYGHRWVVELAYRNFFFFKFILSCQQFDNCSHCLRPVANLPPVSLAPVVHLDLQISPRIKKNSKRS
jgi:hypothetical protein